MTDLQSNPLVGEQAAVQGAVGRVVPHEIIEAEAEQVAPISLSPGLLAWRKFRRHKLAMASAIFLIFISLTAIFARSDRARTRTRRRGSARSSKAPPARTGSAPTRSAATSTAASSTAAASRSRSVSPWPLSRRSSAPASARPPGYFGGKLDNFVMRVTDLFIALPLLVVLILLAQPARAAAVGEAGHGERRQHAGHDRHPVACSSGCRPRASSAVSCCRLKEKEFVEAARAVGRRATSGSSSATCSRTRPARSSSP